MSQSIAAEILREARDQASLSQGQLADAAKTYQSVIGRIEAGKSSPSLETLERLVGAAGFNLEIELVPQPSPDPVIEVYKQGIDRTLLIDNLRKSVDERLRINAELYAFGVEADRALKRVAERDQ